MAAAELLDADPGAVDGDDAELARLKPHWRPFYALVFAEYRASRLSHARYARMYLDCTAEEWSRFRSGERVISKRVRATVLARHRKWRPFLEMALRVEDGLAPAALASTHRSVLRLQTRADVLAHAIAGDVDAGDRAATEVPPPDAGDPDG